MIDKGTGTTKDMEFSNNFKTTFFIFLKSILKVLKIVSVCIFGPIALLLILALFNRIGIINYAFVVPLFIFFFVGLAASADPTNLVLKGRAHLIILGVGALSLGLIAGKLLGKQWGVLSIAMVLYIYYVYKLFKK